jgi:hypothetical protein
MMPKNTISDVLDYFFNGDKPRKEIMRAMQEFFNRPDLKSGANIEIFEGGEGLFNEWLAYDFTLKNGSSLIMDYYRNNPGKKKQSEMEIYRSLADSVYSLFKVLNVSRGTGMDVMDIIGKKQYSVKENMGSYQLKKGDVIFARVASLNGQYEFVGADTPHLPLADGAMPALEKTLFKGIKLTPKFYYDLMSSVYEKDALKPGAESRHAPRNEFEICALFEPLLFFRTEYFLDEPSKINISNRDIELLEQSGVINRIFRRWFQTTWGDDIWTSHFRGETPRQELGRYYPEINSGEMFITAKLEKNFGSWIVKPVVFSKVKDKSADLYDFAFKESKKTTDKLFYPVYDKNFHRFSLWVEDTIEKTSIIGRDDYGEDIFSKRFGAFWDNAGANIILNLGLKAPRAELLAASIVLQEIMTRYFKSYRAGHDNFLNTDTIFHKIWNVIASTESELINFDALMDKNAPKNKKYEYSSLILYRLGIVFDEFVLFPLNQYFNGAEMVWTSKDNFISDLLVTYELLRKSKNMSNRDMFRGYKTVAAMEELEEVWISPCTSFRLIGKVCEFFKAIN